MPAATRCQCDGGEICQWCEAKIQDHLDRVDEHAKDEMRAMESREEERIDGLGPIA